MEESLLQQPVNELPFSADLKNMLADNQVTTLGQLLDIHMSDWQQNLPGFNFHHQHEVINYLQNNNLMDYLKED